MKLVRKELSAGMVMALSLCGARVLRADVTIRYQTDFKTAPSMQALMGKFTKSIGVGAAPAVRVKGNKAYTTTGSLLQIFDLRTQEVTLIDPAQKTYATFPAAQLGELMTATLPQPKPEQMQAAQEAMAKLKTNIESRETGESGEIMGVAAGERIIVMSMEMPAQANQTSPSGAMKLVMHLWTAKKEEALRNPAIRELTAYQAWQKYMFNPASMFQKMAGRMPGMNNGIGSALEEVFKNPSVILRVDLEMYLPFLAAMARQMPGQSESKSLDPDAPILEMNQELAELSTAPVDAKVFEIPADYSKTEPDAMIRELVKAQTEAH